jgi:putative endonuclease
VLAMYYTYVLQRDMDKGFYVGFTKDLKLRFKRHSKGEVESTRDRRTLNLIYYEACLSQDDATKREKYLKTYHGKMFIKRMLKSYLTG